MARSSVKWSFSESCRRVAFLVIMVNPSWDKGNAKTDIQANVNQVKTCSVKEKALTPFEDELVNPPPTNPLVDTPEVGFHYLFG